MDKKPIDKGLLLDSLLETSPDWIYFKDLHHRFVLVSRTKARTLRKSPEGLLGKTDCDFYPEDIAEESRKDDQWVLDNEEPIITKEEKVPDPGGGRSWVSTTKAPRYDRSGNLAGTLGISRDITERKDQEVKLESVQALAREIKLTNTRRELHKLV
ncbi:PAS domain-containing protein, partial [Candidatus Bipolaricaulota bacterium]|nr:PAS domain-containing protein [Candidatus Bipolaricaulota bacterium]